MEITKEVLGEVDVLVRKGLAAKAMEDDGKREKKEASEELLAIMSVYGIERHVVEGVGSAAPRKTWRRNIVEGKLREALLLKGMDIVDIDEVIAESTNMSRSEFVVFTKEVNK